MTDMLVLAELMKSIGARIRIFLIDYQDIRKNDYNTTLITQNHDMTRDEVIALVKDEIHGQGFRVTAIHEILDIQGYERLKRQYQEDNAPTTRVIDTAVEAIRPLYLNI